MAIQERSNDWEKYSYNTMITYFLIRLITKLKEKKEEYPLEDMSVPNKYKQIPYIVRYINNNLTSLLAISDIAERFDISESYLMHSFKNYIGITVNQYITHKRIILARKLISSGEQIINIPKKCGFLDYLAFYRTFSRIVGMSPKDYQKELKSEKQENIVED